MENVQLLFQQSSNDSLTFSNLLLIYYTECLHTAKSTESALNHNKLSNRSCYLPPFILMQVILLAMKACSNTSRTSFQLEKTRTFAFGSVDLIHKILLVTASICIIPHKDLAS